MCLQYMKVSEVPDPLDPDLYLDSRFFLVAEEIKNPDPVTFKIEKTLIPDCSLLCSPKHQNFITMYQNSFFRFSFKILFGKL